MKKKPYLAFPGMVGSRFKGGKVKASEILHLMI